MPSIHGDRCCNPYNEKGYRGKDLRRIPSVMKRIFPNFADNAKIYAACRKMKHPRMDEDKHVSSSLDETFDNRTHDTEQNISGSSGVSSLFSSGIESNIKSRREIELEDMLSGLKENFTTLEINDPLRLTILTIVPDAWSLS